MQEKIVTANTKLTMKGKVAKWAWPGRKILRRRDPLGLQKAAYRIHSWVGGLPSGASYTPPVGDAKMRGVYPARMRCLVGPRLMRFTVFIFSFYIFKFKKNSKYEQFSSLNKIQNMNNFQV
jgi:hypothetical protein